MKTTLLSTLIVAVLALGATSCAKKDAGGAAGGGDARATILRDGTKQFMNDMNAGNFDNINKYIADNYVEHGPPEMPGKGPKILKDMMMMYKTAYPDMKMDVIDVLVDGNKVTVISKMSGTWKGELMGMKPNGKAFKDILGMDYLVFNDSNKAAEHWGVIDSYTMMTQLGMIPSNPGGAPPAGDPAAAPPAHDTAAAPAAHNDSAAPAVK